MRPSLNGRSARSILAAFWCSAIAVHGFGCSSSTSGGGDPCAGVECSGHGTCTASGATASCSCDVGYHADALACAQDLLDLSGDMSRVETIDLDKALRRTSFADVLKVRTPAIDETRGRIYVSGTLSPYLAVIDEGTDEIVDDIYVGVHGYFSKQLAVNSTTGILYFTTIEDHRLYRVDPVTKSTSVPISLGGGGALAVDEANDRVYVVGKDEVRIYDGDLSQYTSLAATGAGDIHLVGQSLYAVQQGNSVHVYDVSNPDAVVPTGSYALPAGLRGRFVDVADGTVYVACDPKTVVVITEASPPVTRRFTVSANIGPVKVARALSS